MSVISYFGGKSSNTFIEFINKQIPKDGSIKTYLEPFSGSMATYMDDDTLKFQNVVYNDKNRHQVNLYRCCAEPEKFIPSQPLVTEGAWSEEYCTQVSMLPYVPVETSRISKFRPYRGLSAPV